MTALSFRSLMAACSLSRAQALALMQAASGRSREWLIAHDSDAVDAATEALFHRYVGRRHSGEPIAYITGWREFYGRPFWVNRHTLIPRMDTELLVDTAIRHLSAITPAPGAPLRLCDLGTGSGCIAISLALEMHGSVHVTATDASDEALQVARNNAAWLGASEQIRFLQGHWWDALTGVQRFHGIVSNPPYIREHDVHLSQGDLRFEPMAALRSADAGLADIKAIAIGAAEKLEPGGFLLIEHGFDQQDDVIEIYVSAGFNDVTRLSDLAGNPRALLGFLKPAG